MDTILIGRPSVVASNWKSTAHTTFGASAVGGFNRESAERMREWMKPDSLYRPHEADMRKAEAAVQRLEVRDTASIAKQIVRAVEARRPRKRYAAPWWQWRAVPFIRAFA